MNCSFVITNVLLTLINQKLRLPVVKDEKHLFTLGCPSIINPSKNLMLQPILFLKPLSEVSGFSKIL